MNLRILASGAATLVIAAAIGLPAAADPPGRVGRVAYVEGEVSFQAPQSQDWTRADLNFPVASGEAFWTGDRGRTELRIGEVAARLDAETELDITDLRYGVMRLGLPQGSVEFELFAPPAGGVEVTTPAGDVHLDYPGVYRLDVSAPPDDGSYPAVQLTVLRGEAGAPAANGLTPVYEGQAALLYASYNPQFQDAQDAAIDDFARGRDQQLPWRGGGNEPAAMTGAEDLSAYGQFVDTSDYGQVWFPSNVGADWAPYRDGRWVWIEPWGYTWVDAQPWGFAPFHYGRWAQIDGRWGWVAGQADPQPVWAPALVAFLGGAALGAALGGSEQLAWVPLAPGEAYRPTYHVSDTYLRRLNAPHHAALAYGLGVQPRPWRNGAAATVVPASAVATGAPIRRSAAVLPPQALAAAPAQASAPTLPPPASRVGGHPAGLTRAAAPPARLETVRAAVVAPTEPGRPPRIAGARPTPPKPVAEGGAPVLIAPSEVHNPAAQNRSPAPRPSRPLPPPSRPEAGGPSPAEPASETPSARPPEAAPTLSDQPLRQPRPNRPEPGAAAVQGPQPPSP